MSDDLKALRALVEERDTFGVCHFCPCGVGEDEHDDDCPVPAAEAALARLEAAFAFEPSGPMLAALRKQERIGYDKAREQAARLCDEHAERIQNTSHRDGLGMGDQRSEGVCREIAERIRAMEPEP